MAAAARYDQLAKMYQDAQAAAGDPNSANLNAAAQLQAATQAFDNAQKDLANSVTSENNAAARVEAAASAAASRAKDPNLQQYYAAHAAQAQSQVAVNKSQIQALQATTPAQVASAMASANKANADAQATGLLAPAQAAQAAAQAGNYAAQAAQIAALTPALTAKAGAEAQTAGAQAQIAGAQAGLAPQAAQAAVDKAQADVETARAQAEEIRKRIANMPSEQQTQAATELGLQGAEADLQQKQFALEQARSLMPISIAQAQANVGATQAQTAATQANAMATVAGVGQKTLGPLYGIGDQITRLRQMIASGQIQPQDADTALNSYLNSQLQGATPYQQAQATNQYNLSNRTLDMNQTAQRLQAGTSFAGSTLGMFGQLAQGAGPGNGAALAAGFQAALEMGRQFFGNLGGLKDTPEAPNAAAQQPTVHINIGSGQPTSANDQTAFPSLPQTALPALPQPAPIAAAPTPPAVQAQIPNLPDIAASQQTDPNAWFQKWQERQAQDAAAQRQAAGMLGLGSALPGGLGLPGGGLPRFAQGGVVTQPTIALVGEAGPEAIVPLGQHPTALPGHPAILEAASHMPAAVGQHIDQSPWLQHLERWKGELMAGKVLPVRPGR
jgi:hypothetical protein